MGVAALAAGTVLALAIPATVKDAVDALGRDPASARPGTAAATILVLAAGNALARLLSRFAIIGAAQRIEYDLRNTLFAALQACPPAFYATHRTGDLMARASSDVAAVKSLLGFGIVSLTGTAAAFVGAVAAMISIDPWLTLWALAPYPALLLVAKRVNGVVQRQTEAAQEQLGALSATVQEHLAAISVVRAYTMEDTARDAFRGASEEFLRRSLRLARTQSQFVPLTSLIAGAGVLVILWAGGTAVASGRLSLGALVAFNGYLAYLAWPTIALGWTLSIVRRGLTSMGRIVEITAAAPPLPAPGPPRPAAPAVRFAGLTFAYAGRRPALVRASFEIGAGELVAVVGPTGSGKSTLGVLLARLRDPPPGTVFVDGHDVTALPAGALRASIGYVPQEAFLFSRSVLDNVTLGREGVTRARARAAAALAGVAEEIEALPQGWDTVVGERGLTLSGGQRQRVALARALAGDPPLLVLDDVLASVDAAKEEEIVGGLAGALRGRTVLLVTHRLRAARAARRIVVLEGGRVVESGGHAELLGAGGVYARLWRIQQLEEEIARA